MKYLICYYSKTGTTAEIAGRIGKILGEGGAEVEMKTIDSVTDLSGYDRLILGCPINGMNLVPEFKAFLAAKVAGSGIPVDIFIVSYLFEKGRNFFRKMIAKNTESVRASLNPRSMEIFAGRLPDKLPGFARLIFGTPPDLPLDMRDWGKIEAWTRTLS
ncbi:MAG TPA: flavodoxin domain-containing protein [Rectinemataceae bacterium]|nr:flavodoxin domain-containing protein [Rectinemataceae bacterium]